MSLVSASSTYWNHIVWENSSWRTWELAKLWMYVIRGAN